MKIERILLIIVAVIMFITACKERNLQFSDVCLPDNDDIPKFCLSQKVDDKTVLLFKQDSFYEVKNVVGDIIVGKTTDSLSFLGSKYLVRQTSKGPVLIDFTGKQVGHLKKKEEYVYKIGVVNYKLLDKYSYEIQDPKDHRKILTIDSAKYSLFIGELSDGLRSFIIYPYNYTNYNFEMDKGIVGWLDSLGNIAIPPKFESTLIGKGFGENTYQFKNGRTLVNEGKEKFFINKLGEKVFTLPDSSIYVTSFNKHGYMSYNKQGRRDCVYVLDTLGKLVFKTNPEKRLGIPGNSWSKIHDDVNLLTSNDRIEALDGNFNQIGEVLLEDEEFLYSVRRNVLIATEKESKEEKYKILLKDLYKPISSWMPMNIQLFPDYNVFIKTDSIKSTLYSFSGKKLFETNQVIHKQKFGTWSRGKMSSDLGVFSVSKRNNKASLLFSGSPLYLINYKGQRLDYLFPFLKELKPSSQFFKIKELNANTRPLNIVNFKIKKSFLDSIYEANFH